GMLMSIVLCQCLPNIKGAEAVQAWVSRYNGSGNSTDVSEALVVDGDGKVYVTGYSFGSSGSADFATLAYSQAGAPLWTNRYDGAAGGWDEAEAIAADPTSGQVVVTGYSSRADGYHDCVTIAYSRGGASLWT